MQSSTLEKTWFFSVITRKLSPIFSEWDNLWYEFPGTNGISWECENWLIMKIGKLYER